jgi:hypothetical protein
MMPLPPLSDLELLARHAPTIYGRALDPDKPTLTPQPVNGRPDWVDGRSGQGGELGKAVGALRALLAVQAEGKVGAQTAGVLWLVHVLCGVGAAPRAYVLASAHFGRLGPLPPEPPTPPQRGKRTSKGLRVADERQRAAWGAWERQRAMRSAEGLVLYATARGLWEARVQRRTG